MVGEFFGELIWDRTGLAIVAMQKFWFATEKEFLKCTGRALAIQNLFDIISVQNAIMRVM